VCGRTTALPISLWQEIFLVSLAGHELSLCTIWLVVKNKCWVVTVHRIVCSNRQPVVTCLDIY